MPTGRRWVWVAGIALAVIGVAIARLPGGELLIPDELTRLLVGSTIATVGLYFFTKGITPVDKDDAGPTEPTA
ncbi:MAG: hypothetical protein ABT940_11990 [Alphaproteobacteria bacterium]